MEMGLALPAAITAKSVSPRLSEKYVRVDSEKVVNLMAEEGFILADVIVGKRAHEHSRHMLDFRHVDADLIADGQAVPRILFGNSHDGSTRAFFAMGLFRIVCSNGLVAGNVTAQDRIRHIGDPAKDLVARMQKLARETAPLAKQVDTWRKKVMSQSAMLDFAKRAAELRFEDPNRFDLSELLRPKRDEDDSDTLWSVFNRVQENTTYGGIIGRSATGRAIVSRPIQAVTRNFDYNKALWELAEDFV